MTDNISTEGYRILVLDMTATDAAAKASSALAAALADGSFSPTSQTFSPSGRFLIVTLINNKKAAELLGRLLGESLPAGGQGSGGFGFGGSGLS